MTNGNVCAQRLSVLAEPTRLAVVQALLGGPRYPWELALELEVEQSLLSHHLRVLREARLVRTRREGRHVLYALKPGAARRGRIVDLGCCQLRFLPCGERT